MAPARTSRGELPSTSLRPAALVAVPADVRSGAGLPDPPPRHLRRPGRAVDRWDLVGLAWLAAAMLGVQQAVVALLDTGLGRAPGLRVAAIVVATATATATAALAVGEQLPPRVLRRRLARVWRDPPGPWLAAALGALLALPVLALYTPVLLKDADSARVVASVTHVNEHGIRFFQETQTNFLPQVVYGPVVALAGLPGVKLVSLLSLLAVAAVCAYITYRVSSSLVGAGAGAVAALAIPSLLERGNYVPMYPVMLALGYLGGWFAYRAATEARHPWRPAVAAGLCLAVAPEAQPVGVLFAVTPVLVAVLAPSARAALAGAGRVYLVLAVASLPRLALNLSVGGLDSLASYRTDYWATEGYLSEIQRNFWHYSGIDDPLGTYLSRLPIRFARGFGGPENVVLWLGIAAWLLACRGRARAFVAMVGGAYVAAITVKQIPPFARYYSPMWPGFAILAGVAAGRLANARWALVRASSALVVAVLVVGAAVSFREVADDDDGFRQEVEDGPYRELAALVDDGKGVIGARSHALVNVTADIPTWGGQFLTEDEYVTYLSWPSDRAVVEVMRRHDIGWALVHRLPLLETAYHDTWLAPHHGVRARQPWMLALSPSFCRVAEDDGFVLYRLGACPAGPAAPP